MLAQLLANGFATACAYALIALGFGLIYYTSRIFHIAHGAIYTLSAYLFYTVYAIVGWPLLPSALLSVVMIGFVGVGVDLLIYRPLARRGASPLIMLLSSLGLYILLVNFIAMIYGNEVKIPSPGIQPTYSFAGVILTQIQLATICTSLVAFAMFAVALRKLRFGKLVRALRDDPDLLAVLGHDPYRVRTVVFGIGSGLACIAAVLVAMDVGFDPQIGLSALLSAAVAVIIGGVGVFEAAALGALLLGVAQSLVIWQFSARWQDTLTFVVLILFLLFRPQGLLGVKGRVEEATVR
jgi:branched-chain amino acid transport system permease protein